MQACAASVPAGDLSTAPSNERSTLQAPIVYHSLLDQVEQLNETNAWEPFRPGVTAHWIYREPDGGPAAVFLRYEPGAVWRFTSTSAMSTYS